MLVLHAAWSKGSLQIWAESEEHARESLSELLGQKGRNLTPEPDQEEGFDALTGELLETATEVVPAVPEGESAAGEIPSAEDAPGKREAMEHVYVAKPQEVRELLGRTGALEECMIGEETTLTMHLPHRMHGRSVLPEPSERLASELGWSHEKDALQLEPVIVSTLPVHARHAAEFLVGLEDRLDGRQGRADPGVVGDRAFLQGNVEVHADEDGGVGDVDLVDGAAGLVGEGAHAWKLLDGARPSRSGGPR